jgi:hypothetical protein
LVSESRCTRVRDSIGTSDQGGGAAFGGEASGCGVTIAAMTWVLDLARHQVATDDSVQLFGVIIYTDAHAHLKKVLRDADYWASFDALSGPRFAVYSIRAYAGEWVSPPARPGSLATMHEVWREPTANAELVRAFALDDTRDLPALVVFALDGDEHYSTSLLIDESSIESCYTSLKDAMIAIASALSKGASERSTDSRVVFKSVKSALSVRRNWQRVRDGYKVLSELKKWVSVF